MEHSTIPTTQVLEYKILEDYDHSRLTNAINVLLDRAESGSRWQPYGPLMVYTCPMGPSDDQTIYTQYVQAMVRVRV